MGDPAMMRSTERESPLSTLFHARLARTVHPRCQTLLRISIMCLSLLSAASLAPCALAADADATTAAAAGGLEEVVVTAEKYNSTIQNTPISISAITGEQLIAAGITSVEEVTREVPGLSMRSAGPG